MTHPVSYSADPSAQKIEKANLRIKLFDEISILQSELRKQIQKENWINVDCLAKKINTLKKELSELEAK